MGTKYVRADARRRGRRYGRAAPRERPRPEVPADRIFGSEVTFDPVDFAREGWGRSDAPVAAPPASRPACHGHPPAGVPGARPAYLRRTRKRAPRQLTLFEKPEPGDSVQIDVKFVRIGRRWAVQYTAIDDCTRFRVLCLYRRLNTATSLAFLTELRRAFPFAIRRLQCDNGREFSFEFALAVEAAGIRLRYIRPRRPQQNGKVERSHRIDHEECWSRHHFPDFETAETALHWWETQYNCHRLSIALNSWTPAEKLVARLAPPAA